jgi:hypothetical protein
MVTLHERTKYKILSPPLTFLAWRNVKYQHGRGTKCSSTNRGLFHSQTAIFQRRASFWLAFVTVHCLIRSKSRSNHLIAVGYSYGLFIFFQKQLLELYLQKGKFFKERSLQKTCLNANSWWDFIIFKPFAYYIFCRKRNWIRIVGQIPDFNDTKKSGS